MKNQAEDISFKRIHLSLLAAMFFFWLTGIFIFIYPSRNREEEYKNTKDTGGNCQRSCLASDVLVWIGCTGMYFTWIGIFVGIEAWRN